MVRPRGSFSCTSISLFVSKFTPLSKWMPQLPKGGLIRAYNKPIHGSCAIYLNPEEVLPENASGFHTRRNHLQVYCCWVLDFGVHTPKTRPGFLSYMPPLTHDSKNVEVYHHSKPLQGQWLKKTKTTGRSLCLNSKGLRLFQLPTLQFAILDHSKHHRLYQVGIYSLQGFSTYLRINTMYIGT